MEKKLKQRYGRVCWIYARDQSLTAAKVLVDMFDLRFIIYKSVNVTLHLIHGKKGLSDSDSSHWKLK